MRKQLTVLFLIVAAIGLLFVSLGAPDGTAKGFGQLLAISLVLSGLAGPELAPKAFQRPRVWQVCTAVAGVQLFALASNTSLEGHFLALVVGVILGYVGPPIIRNL